MLNRRQKYRLFKVFALLSLVRWWSILTVVSGMYLIAVFLLNEPIAWWATIKDIELHLTIYSTACLVASGFIINNFYDLERDIINRPQNVVFKRLISQQSALNFYFIFNLIGMILAFYVSKKVMLYNFLFGTALWFYSHKLEKRVFTSNLSATLLSLAPFAALSVLYRDVNFALFFYMGYLAIIVLMREFLKDLISLPGDKEFGYRSFALVHGITTTQRLFLGLGVLSVLPVIGLYLTYAIQETAIYYFVLSYITLLIIAVFVLLSGKPNKYTIANNILKVLLGLGLLNIPFV